MIREAKLNRYTVYLAGWDRDGEGEFDAATPERAAEAFCAWLDPRVVEYPPEREVVVRDSAGVAGVFVVTLRSVPEYTARRKR